MYLSETNLHYHELRSPHETCRLIKMSTLSEAALTVRRRRECETLEGCRTTKLLSLSSHLLCQHFCLDLFHSSTDAKRHSRRYHMKDQDQILELNPLNVKVPALLEIPAFCKACWRFELPQNFKTLSADIVVEQSEVRQNKASS